MKLKMMFTVFILLILTADFIASKEKKKIETGKKTQIVEEEVVSYSEIKKMFKYLNVKVEVDKKLYHSGENILTKVTINSPFAIPDVYLRVYGIYANRNRIEEYRQVSINEGDNTFEFTFTTPKCYGCAGISPGMYDIAVDVAPIVSTGKTEIEVQQ